MTRRHHRRVVLVIKGGVAKVNDFHIGLPQCSLVSPLKANRNARQLQTVVDTGRLDHISIKLPFHGYIPCHNLHLLGEYFQASSLCESVCSCAELKQNTNIYMHHGFFFLHLFLYTV